MLKEFKKYEEMTDTQKVKFLEALVADIDSELDLLFEFYQAMNMFKREHYIALEVFYEDLLFWFKERNAALTPREFHDLIIDILKEHGVEVTDYDLDSDFYKHIDSFYYDFSIITGDTPEDTPLYGVVPVLFEASVLNYFLS